MYWLLVFDKTLKVLTAGLFVCLFICFFVKPLPLSEVELIGNDYALLFGFFPWLALLMTVRLSWQQAQKDFKRRMIYRRMF